MRKALALPVLFLSLSLSCAAPPPRIETGPDAEVTHDGLHRVSRTRRFQHVWIKPGASLEGYSKIQLIDAGVRYRRPSRPRRREFTLSESQLENLRGGLHDAIAEELERGGDWEIVTERGPDALVVRAALIDLVLAASTETSVRDRSFTSSAGEATLVLEVFDSESLEILARAADRRAASRDTGAWRNDSINNRAAARSLFRDWARRLRDALEFARSAEATEAANPAAAAEGAAEAPREMQ